MLKETLDMVMQLEHFKSTRCKKDTKEQIAYLQKLLLADMSEAVTRNAEQWPKNVLDEIVAHRKIAAIKAYRENITVNHLDLSNGLRDCKEAVEKKHRDLGYKDFDWR